MIVTSYAYIAIRTVVCALRCSDITFFTDPWFFRHILLRHRVLFLFWFRVLSYNARIASGNGQIGKAETPADQYCADSEVDVFRVIENETGQEEAHHCEDSECWQKTPICINSFLQSGPKVIAVLPLSYNTSIFPYFLCVEDTISCSCSTVRLVLIFCYSEMPPST